MRTAPLLLMLVVSPALADDEEPAASGFFDGAIYGDTRSAGTFTGNLLVDLPHRVQVFGFVNLQSAYRTDRPWEVEGVYAEQHLRWAPSAKLPLDLTLHTATASGPDNDVLRLGVRWRLHNTGALRAQLRDWGLWYTINLHGPQLDTKRDGSLRPMLEHAYGWTLWGEALDRRLSVGGFADHALRLGGEPKDRRSVVVTEHQVAVRLIAQVHAVAEARWNGWLPQEDRFGVGMGLMVKTQFESR